MDPLFDDLLKYTKNLKNQLQLKDTEIKMLRQHLATIDGKKKTPASTKVKIVEEYNALDFVKWYQKTYRATLQVTLYIHNWANATKAMKQVISAFLEEGYTKRDVEKFLAWAVLQKTHTGEFVPIGYLPCLINKYWSQIIQPVKETSPTITEKIKQNLRTIFGD